MNVLVITKDVNVLREGSASRQKMEEYAELASHLFVIVLNTRRNKYDVQKVSDKLWIYPTNSWSMWSAPFGARHVAHRELWFQGKLQVSLITALDPCESGLAGVLIQRFSDRPLQVHVMSNVFSTFFRAESFGNIIRSAIAKYVLKHSQGIRVATANIRAAIADISTALSDRAFILPRIIEAEQLLREPVRVDLHEKYPAFKFIVLMVAPLIKRQNIDLALTVMQGILHVYKHAGLVIVGEGSEGSHIVKRAHDLGIDERVVIEPWNDNLSSYYKTSNVFLVTAVYEEYGDTIAEAAATGAAIVTTNVGVASTIIEHGDSGFICDPDHPETFVKSILSIMQNPGIRERIKINGTLFLSDYVGQSREEHLRLYQQAWEKVVTDWEKQ
jgi:glycosyltransferase involved in cell wall biosynthesis